MFDAARNDVPAFLAQRTRDAEDRIVVGLGAAAGKDDFTFLRAKKVCDTHTRVVDGGAGFAAEDVHATRVAEVLPQVGQHRVQDLRIQRRGCVVVCVNASHQIPAPSEWPIILSRSLAVVFIFVSPPSWYTTVFGGTGSSSHTLPPMIEPLPMVTSPKMVAPA